MRLLKAIWWAFLATASNDPEIYCKKPEIVLKGTWFDPEYRKNVIDNFNLGDVL